jgi:hypothetical protein
MQDYDKIMETRVNAEYVTTLIDKWTSEFEDNLLSLVNSKLDALERKANIKNLFIDKEEDNEFTVSNQLKALHATSL